MLYELLRFYRFVCFTNWFRNSPHTRNPLIYCVNRYCLRSASVGAKRTSTGCSAPHIWRVPSSKALSCKHERLFDLLTLISFYCINHTINIYYRVDKIITLWYYLIVAKQIADGVWLSLVERYVRDVEAASSNLVTSILIKSHRYVICELSQMAYFFVILRFRTLLGHYSNKNLWKHMIKYYKL